MAIESRVSHGVARSEPLAQEHNGSDANSGAAGLSLQT